MSTGERCPSPQADRSRIDTIAGFVGEQLHTMVVAPVAEYLERNQYLGKAAAVFLCTAAMWGATESPAMAAGTFVGPSPIVARSNPGISGGEVVIPAPAPPAANAECGDPSYRAPKQGQIDSMLCRFNNARTNPLVEDPELDAAAQEKLDEIVADHHYSHRPLSEDEDPFQYTKAIKGVEGTWVMGEDLAQGEGKAAKVRALFSAWRHSADHWRNIINERYTNVGFAVKHLKRIVMDVDVEIGGETYTIQNEVLQNVTIWDAEFWGQ